MTEFKPGDRVQWRLNDSLYRGTVEYVYDGCVYGTRDAGGRFVVWPGDLTLRPFAFEDVRDGDTITVEGIDYSTTGTASKPDGPECVTVGGVTVFNFDGDEGTHGPYGPPVYHTDHTPAEPEWHRAKVINADPVRGELPGCTGGYLLRDCDGDFLNEYGSALAPSDLTNVTIIVDEYGKVPAEAAALTGDERREAH